MWLVLLVVSLGLLLGAVVWFVVTLVQLGRVAARLMALVDGPAARAGGYNGRIPTPKEQPHVEP